MSENKHPFSGNVVTDDKGTFQRIDLDNMKEVSDSIEKLKTPSPPGETERDTILTANKDVMNESTAKAPNLEQSPKIASGIQGGPVENISSEDEINQDSKENIGHGGGKRRTRGRKSSRRKQKGSSRRNRRKSNKRKRRNKK